MDKVIDRTETKCWKLSVTKHPGKVIATLYEWDVEGGFERLELFGGWRVKLFDFESKRVTAKLLDTIAAEVLPEAVKLAAERKAALAEGK